MAHKMAQANLRVFLGACNLAVAEIFEVSKDFAADLNVSAVSNAQAVASEEAEFWPVTRVPSVIT